LALAVNVLHLNSAQEFVVFIELEVFRGNANRILTTVAFSFAFSLFLLYFS
jgi:hypothetical protein